MLRIAIFGYFLDFFKVEAEKHVEIKATFQGYMSAYQQLYTFSKGVLTFSQINKKLCEELEKNQQMKQS